MLEVVVFPTAVGYYVAMPTVTDPQGWTVSIYPRPGLPTFKVIAVSPDRKRVLHFDKQTAEMVAAIRPESRWQVGL